MKGLIAFFVRRYRLFLNCFSTYELCQPEEGIFSAQPPQEKFVVPQVQPVDIAKPIVIAEEIRRRQRRRGGLGSGFDQYIANLKVSVKAASDTFNQGQSGRDYTFRR